MVAVVSAVVVNGGCSVGGGGVVFIGCVGRVGCSVIVIVVESCNCGGS